MCSILPVEDNPMDVELAQRAFQRSQLTDLIVVARDGKETLASIPRWEAGAAKPALLLLDINMPRLNGLEVLRELKSQPVSANIPVIMLTTSSAGRDIEAANDGGANPYIVKPVDFAKFCEVAGRIRFYWSVLNVPAS